jgi:hypothetical protein
MSPYESGSPSAWRQRLAGAAEFVRRPAAGEYEVDDSGFDPDFSNIIVMPAALAL